MTTQIFLCLVVTWDITSVENKILCIPCSCAFSSLQAELCDLKISVRFTYFRNWHKQEQSTIKVWCVKLWPWRQVRLNRWTWAPAENFAEGQEWSVPMEYGLGRDAIAPPQYSGLGYAPEKNCNVQISVLAHLVRARWMRISTFNIPGEGNCSLLLLSAGDYVPGPPRGSTTGYDTKSVALPGQTNLGLLLETTEVVSLCSKILKQMQAETKKIDIAR